MLAWSLLSAVQFRALFILIMAHISACTYWDIGLGLALIYREEEVLCNYEYAGSVCDVYYLDQPINEFTCDPTLSDVRLECTIYYKNDKSYDIFWYKIPLGVDQANPELVNTHRLSQNPNYFGGKLIKSQLYIPMSIARSHDAAGIYWCQVVLHDESGQASSLTNGSFKASSPFLLRPPEQYSSFPPCSDVYQSQPRSECARNGINPPSSSNPPPVTSIRINTPPTNQIVTASVPNRGSGTDSSSNDLPPWGYAVIAGGGIASMIIITVIVCILLAFCQSLQKYKARLPLELEDAAISSHGASHGQSMGRPPLPMRNSETSTTRVPPYHVAMIKREPDPSDYFEMRPVSIRGMASIGGPPSATGAFQGHGGAHPGIIGLPRGDEWGRKAQRIGHRHSISTASSSTVEINDHIYHTIMDQYEDEAYHSPIDITDGSTAAVATCTSRQNVRSRLLCRSSQNLRGPLLSESVAKSKTPPPKLLNSPKSTACLKTSKLPLVPSSQSVRIISSSSTSTTTTPAKVAATTVDQDQDTTTTRESPPRPTQVETDLKQKQHKAQSPETNDYVSLCSTPRTSAVM